MRRGGAAGPNAGGAEDGIDEGAGRALALAAGDVDDPVLSVRGAQRVEQPPGADQPAPRRLIAGEGVADEAPVVSRALMNRRQRNPVVAVGHVLVTPNNTPVPSCQIAPCRFEP